MLHIVWGGRGGGGYDSYIYDSYTFLGSPGGVGTLWGWGSLARAFARSPVRSPVRSLAHPLARTLVRTYNPPSYNTSGNALKSSLATF